MVREYFLIFHMTEASALGGQQSLCEDRSAFGNPCSCSWVGNLGCPIVKATLLYHHGPAASHDYFSVELLSALLVIFLATKSFRWNISLLVSRDVHGPPWTHTICLISRMSPHTWPILLLRERLSDLYYHCFEVSLS